VHPAVTTKVVEFNDVPALEAALAAGDVAAVLAEPVMTNIGIIHPEPGFHQQLREITRRYDEQLSHTLQFTHARRLQMHKHISLLHHRQ
jgi:glutamate-1-semialdehyde aminotransferase